MPFTIRSCEHLEQYARREARAGSELTHVRSGDCVLVPVREGVRQAVGHHRALQQQPVGAHLRQTAKTRQRLHFLFVVRFGLSVKGSAAQVALGVRWARVGCDSTSNSPWGPAWQQYGSTRRQIGDRRVPVHIPVGFWRVGLGAGYNSTCRPDRAEPNMYQRGAVTRAMRALCWNWRLTMSTQSQSSRPKSAPTTTRLCV